MNQGKEPNWLSLPEVLAVHEKLLALFGGSGGVRDLRLLDSALARAKNLYLYEKADLCLLAAQYADGIVNNHPFIDGNKRTGFIAATLFLETNGGKFSASEVQAVTITLGLADGSITATDYANWLRENTNY